MKILELRDKTEKELDDMLKEAREQVRASRFKVALKQLKNVRGIRVQKHLIARILTLHKARKSQ